MAVIGSTRFFKELPAICRRETLSGKIVLRPHVVKSVTFENAPVTPNQRRMLDQLRLAEIEMADEVLVLNIDGYVGNSTFMQVDHALSLGRPVRWEDPSKIPPEFSLKS